MSTVVTASKVAVDFTSDIGVIKPMHAINNAPFRHGNSDQLHYLREANIPYARLHDTGGPYGGFCYVDIENIVRDKNADVDDPASYDFVFTDWLIGELIANGAEPFYRLGATIENDSPLKAYHIFPPESPERWARICEHIVRHYNDGWADGFYYNIKYWEIWNEPDNEPEIKDNPMWKGTAEQYFELYAVTARYLKQTHPDIKVGGYASCGFYSIFGGESAANANCSPRVRYFTDFFLDFLAYISRDDVRAPLDFFSWHTYSCIADAVVMAQFARDTLNKYGFTQTESILNEWNPGIHMRGTLQDAASVAAYMCAMQSTSVDMLMYYDGQFYSRYGGLFSPMTFEPFKAYYAFKAFGELYGARVWRRCECDNDNLFVLASGSLLMIVNLSADTVNVDVTARVAAPASVSLRLIDEERSLDEASEDLFIAAVEGDCVKTSLTLKPWVVALQSIAGS